MASDNVRPEIAAFRELEVVVRRALREVAAVRRPGEPVVLDEPVVRGEPLTEGEGEGLDLRAFDLELRLANLERENAILRERLTVAGARAQQMLERVHFLRQQTQVGGEQ